MDSAKVDMATIKQRLGTCWSSFTKDVRESSQGRYAREFFTKKSALRKFPIITWLPKYRLKHFIGDFVAGLTVGLTVLPQGLAYATVAELPPQYGLYASYLGVFIYCIFGTSKDVTVSPVAILSLLTAEFASDRSPVKGDPTYAILLTFICGLIQLGMGLLNMGFVVQFMSMPVISGFGSAAAIIIAFGQIKTLLGLKGVPRAFVPQLVQTCQKLPTTNLWDMTMGLICMALLLSMKRLNDYITPKLKEKRSKCGKVVVKTVWLLCTARNAVIVLICAGIAAVLLDVYGIKGLTLTTKIPSGIPSPSIPKFSINVTHGNETITRSTQEIFSDIGEGFLLVALIGILESIAIAKAFARRFDYTIDPSQELLAMGIANTVSSFFTSYPITGSFSSGSAINGVSGVRTPAGGIWTGALVILALLVLTPYFRYIPQTALAAVIICAVLPMIEFELIPHLWKVKKSDLFPFLVTFIVSVFADVEYGLITGVALSLLILLFPMARPGLKITHEKFSQDNGTSIQVDGELVIIQPDHGLRFPGVEYIKDKAMKHGVFETPQKSIILDAHRFTSCDFTTIQGVASLSEYFHKRGLKFIVAGCGAEVKETFLRADIHHLVLTDTTVEAIDMIINPDTQTDPEVVQELPPASEVSIWQDVHLQTVVDETAPNASVDGYKHLPEMTV